MTLYFAGVSKRPQYCHSSIHVLPKCLTVCLHIYTIVTLWIYSELLLPELNPKNFPWAEAIFAVGTFFFFFMAILQKKKYTAKNGLVFNFENNLLYRFSIVGHLHTAPNWMFHEPLPSLLRLKVFWIRFCTSLMQGISKAVLLLAVL